MLTKGIKYSHFILGCYLVVVTASELSSQGGIFRQQFQGQLLYFTGKSLFYHFSGSLPTPTHGEEVLVDNSTFS